MLVKDDRPDQWNKKPENFNIVIYIWTAHPLGALVLGMVNEVSCMSLYHYTHRKNTVVVTKNLLCVEFRVIILLHEWVDRGQMHQLKKLLCV